MWLSSFETVFPNSVLNGREINDMTISELWHKWITVDDHNETLEEEGIGDGLTDGQKWEDENIEPRRASNQLIINPKICGVNPSLVASLSLLDFFVVMFPMELISTIVLPNTNTSLPRGSPPVTEHDFVKFLGV